MRTSTSSHASTARRDLLVSLGLFGLIVVVVLGGLAHDANWRKLLRIALAASTYVTVLLALLRLQMRAAKPDEHLPFWAFAMAAGTAELASGWLRLGVPDRTTLWVAPLAALLIGGIHWLALRAWRQLRDEIMLGRSAASATRLTNRSS